MGRDVIMAEKLTRLLVTKLSSSVHDRLKELARKDRRTLSSLSRLIIEDHINGFENESEKDSAKNE
jgi:predicted DNA-binding protein